ncbi:MAG: hypothetical protein QNJ06_06660 [Kiloniellales bacterium]|nr:hypothetical protein [Kiloniellales bacterium]MDJ0982841.1 hypothetical protein [Kiloniellales bacterium]
MAQDAFNWKSFWEIATPEEAARILTDWFGIMAAQLAVDCALAAGSDQRDDDRRFWLAVLDSLTGSTQRRSRAQPTAVEAGRAAPRGAAIAGSPALR